MRSPCFMIAYLHYFNENYPLKEWYEIKVDNFERKFLIFFIFIYFFFVVKFTFLYMTSHSDCFLNSGSADLLYQLDKLKNTILGWSAGSHLNHAKFSLRFMFFSIFYQIKYLSLCTSVLVYKSYTVYKLFWEILISNNVEMNLMSRQNSKEPGNVYKSW